MSNASTPRKRAEYWRHDHAEKTLAPVIPLKPFGMEAAAVGAAPGSAAISGIGYWRPDLDSRDRKWIDALVGIALVVLGHYSAVEYFKHQPPREITPPKEREVQISLLKPAPPPPPPPVPVVKPQPPAPPKDAIPPKPKPKPKKLPPPVVQRVPTPQKIVDAPTAPAVSEAPPAPVKAQPAPPPPPPANKFIQVSNADYLSKPQPEYPEDAVERGLQGKVIVKARILANGRTDSVQVQKSSGYAMLDSAALQAVRKALFKPNMQGDTATVVWAIIPINFQL